MRNNNAAGEPSIQERVDEYLEHCVVMCHNRSTTILSKRHTYRHFVAEIGVDRLSELDNSAYGRWARYQDKTGARKTSVNTRITHVVTMLKYFRYMGYEMPVKIPLIKREKASRSARVYYSREEIKGVLSSADELTWLLVSISFDTGMRIAELTSLGVDNFCGRRVNYTGKGNKNRESYISATTHEKLDEYIEKHNLSSHLWVNRDGEMYSQDQLRRNMKMLFARSGYGGFYPHALRHSFAVDKQRQGATVSEIKMMMGHESERTTESYMHGFDGQLEGLFSKYGGGEAPDGGAEKKDVGESSLLGNKDIVDLIIRLGEELRAIKE